MEGGFEIRTIRQEEALEAAMAEKICFPPNEACTEKHMIERVAAGGDLFLVAIDKENGKMAGYITGLATDEEALRDEFFTDASLHNPNGKNILILSVGVLPEYRGRGLCRQMMDAYIKREAQRGRERLILTCLDGKISMYAKMGYEDLGESASTWGGDKWHEMDIKLGFLNIQ